MSLEEIKDEIDAALILVGNDEIKENLLYAILNTVCLAEFLKDTTKVKFAYKSILSSKETNLKDCNIEQLALLSCAVTGALLKNYL